MCDPVSAGMFALNAAGQVGQHSAQSSAVKARNRARLKNFDAANQQYLNEVKLDNAEWKNNVQVQEIEQDQVYRSMVDQWTQQDAQLDQIFADSDFALQDKLIQMYENDYAGTGTGKSAARLAGKSAKKFGFEKAKLLSDMMIARKQTDLSKEAVRQDASYKSNALFEKVRFAPIHGHTPLAPELEAKPSKAGLVLGLATSALGAYGTHKSLKAIDVKGGSDFNPKTDWGSGYGGFGGTESTINMPEIPPLDIDWSSPNTGPTGDFFTGNNTTIATSMKLGDFDLSGRNVFG